MKQITYEFKTITAQGEFNGFLSIRLLNNTNPIDFKPIFENNTLINFKRNNFIAVNGRVVPMQSDEIIDVVVTNY